MSLKWNKSVVETNSKPIKLIWFKLYRVNPSNLINTLVLSCFPNSKCCLSLFLPFTHELDFPSSHAAVSLISRDNVSNCWLLQYVGLSVSDSLDVFSSFIKEAIYYYMFVCLIVWLWRGGFLNQRKRKGLMIIMKMQLFLEDVFDRIIQGNEHGPFFFDNQWTWPLWMNIWPKHMFHVW